MNTNFDLIEKCKRLNITLIGVYCKDELPRVKRNGCYIVNMQDDYDSETGEDLPGSHWICFIIKINKAYYFDSFGFPPPEIIKQYLKPYKTMYNLKEIQSLNSSTCGSYVLAFLIYLTKIEWNIESFVKMFDDNTRKNNEILDNKRSTTSLLDSLLTGWIQGTVQTHT